MILIPRINFRYVKKFLAIVGSVAGIYLLVAVIVTGALIINDNQAFTPTMPTAQPIGEKIESGASSEEERPEPTPGPDPGEDEDDSFLKPANRTYFIFIGLDQERVLTDALMVGCFYRDACEIRLMSIPRDLYTIIPEERLQRMRDDGLKPPKSGIMKINALRSYGGRAFGVQYLTEQLSDMLGVPIQYYVEMDIPAFRKIVDILGGVEMEIPKDGLHYEDPEQDLYIHIPGGVQFLDGATAEGLVRFRRYPSGDVGRNAVQMEFIKQLFRQVLTREAIMRDPAGLADILINDVRTNIGTDLIKYVPYVSQFSSEKIKTYTMPGEGGYVKEASYFFPDEKTLADTVNEVFFAVLEPEEPLPEASGMPTVKAGASKDLRIQVLNGSRVAGRASSFADILKTDGYNVVNVDTYKGTAEDKTRVLVKEEGIGEDLIPYFKNAAIKTDTSFSGDYDIVIVVGRGE